MPLSIPDDDVENKPEPEQGAAPLGERIKKIQDEFKTLLGPHKVEFDMKAFMDEGWESEKGNFSLTDIERA
jgi:hypothetical protein